MSRTYAIACTQCRKRLWIAQGAGYEKITRISVYTNEKSINGLTQFLTDHYRHPLIFDDNCESDIAEFDEIDVGDDCA